MFYLFCSLEENMWCYCRDNIDCLSPVWSHVHAVLSELKETHCLHTCHPNIIAAALWEASLTFSGLPVNDASSSPVSNEARNAVKQQAHLSAPYLLVDHIAGETDGLHGLKGSTNLKVEGKAHGKLWGKDSTTSVTINVWLCKNEDERTTDTTEVWV